MFLWFLDDGKVEGKSWSDLRPLLSDPRLFAERVTRDPEHYDALDMALLGFSKFLVFSIELDDLLERCLRFPILQSAMWHYNAYWFDHLQEKTGRKLEDAIGLLYDWREYSEQPNHFVSELDESLERVRTAIRHLLSGSYKRALEEKALSLVDSGSLARILNRVAPSHWAQTISTPEIEAPTYDRVPASDRDLSGRAIERRGKRIYVGNLSYRATENDVASLFGQAGEVESVSIIIDRDTGRSKGFGFVEMSNEDADKAIAQFNGMELNGRALTVNEARPREERGGGRGRYRDRS
jgi:hypothetical protein